MLITLKKAGRDGIGKAERVDGVAVDGALDAFDVDDDADDLKVVWWSERGEVGEREHLLGVGHLRDGFFGDEGDGVEGGGSRR